MKVLITGAKGQLGRELIKQMEREDYELILTDVDTLDITSSSQVYEYVNKFKPHVIVNCAAHTQVDKCEEEEDKAFLINALGPKNLAQAAYAIGAEMVHISTDYVFPGDINKPLTEFEVTNPQTVYGKTKLIGEELVKEFNPKHYIIRTAWLYGDGNNFVKTMLALSLKNSTLKVVSDQIGTPTSTFDLAKVIIALIKSKDYGTFHCTCKGQCSWYDFAQKIFELKNIEVKVVPCSTEEYPRPAKRPKYSVLRNYMLENTIGDITRPWEEALEDYLNRL